MNLRTYLVIATCGLLLSASCGKDSDGTRSAETDKPESEKAEPVATGIPAAVAGEYALAKASKWQMLQATVYVGVGPDWAKVGKIPDGAATTADSVDLEELAARVAALSPKPPAPKPAEDDSLEPARARQEALKKAIEAGVQTVGEDVPASALFGTGDLLSGPDDRSAYRGLVGPAHMGPLPSPGWISKQAPLLVADKDMKVARVVEVMRSLCRGGALLGVAREGSTVATQHAVAMGALQSEKCPGPPGDKSGFLMPPGARNRAVLAMAESGYEFQGKEVAAKVDKNRLAELTQALARQRAERKGKPVELWLLVDETATVDELVAALDAAAAAEVVTVYLAMTGIQFEDGHRPPGPAPADDQAEPAAKPAALDDQIVEYWLEDSGTQGGSGLDADGLGPAAEGTGWGTIGPRRYSNTVPSGGAEHGRDGMKGRKDVAPRVRLGNLSTAGDLDKNIIHRYLRRKLPRLEYCYEKQLLAEPGLEGTVVANFQIGPSGAVVGSAALGIDKKVSSCVADVIKSIRFPKPKGGGIVQVRYPIDFRPSGG